MVLQPGAAGGGFVDVALPDTEQGAQLVPAVRGTRGVRRWTGGGRITGTVAGGEPVSIHVTVTGVAHGWKIRDNNTSVTASYQTYYPFAVTSSSFDLTIFLPNTEAQYAFYYLLSEFVREMRNAQSLSPVRVSVPKLGFERLGIPKGIWQVRNSVGHIGSETIISFIGTSSPVSFDDPRVARWVAGRQSVGYINPAGYQITDSGVIVDIGGDDFGVDPIDSQIQGALDGVLGDLGGVF